MNSTLNRITNRLRSRDLHHTLGRFKQFRDAYSLYQNGRQQLRSNYHRAQLHPLEISAFSEMSPQEHADNLRATGVSFGFSLPPAEVEQIYRFACETPCTEPAFAGKFYADQVSSGRLNGERHVFRGLVNNPENCPVVASLAQDPKLLQIVRSYLKYWPSQLTYHLSWSFAVDLSEAEQMKRYPPLNYHYDVAGYNFMTTYFYITDIDTDNGPHVMIEKSHNHKPLHTLLQSGANPHLAQQVLDYYGPDCELAIKGKAGFGFVQDPSCFHRLSPLKHGRRLLLQIRYA